MWDLREIAADDSMRASILEAAPPSTELARTITDVFTSALEVHSVRVALEEARSNTSDARVVLQFQVGTKLFDCFFNSRTGYRAVFRGGWESGLVYNQSIIESLRKHLAVLSASTLTARRVNGNFEDCGAITVTIHEVVRSLDPQLSKIWFCSQLLDDGHVAQLPLGLTGPRIRVADDASWAAPHRDDPSAWLEVKGAFVSPAGLYQPKDPVRRAKRLQQEGDA
jgi:hypothetical protein